MQCPFKFSRTIYVVVCERNFTSVRPVYCRRLDVSFDKKLSSILCVCYAEDKYVIFTFTARKWLSRTLGVYNRIRTGFDSSLTHKELVNVRSTARPVMHIAVEDVDDLLQQSPFLSTSSFNLLSFSDM